ncbi:MULTISPECIES: ArsR family transcriptional regulator [unclassified Streptomyces]|uniref:ArsR family transcriptional regulator n=1 Tax=unclassified Streptomyces TaxID=2593676 RepID=UPI001F03CEF0|nr:MULTISPECIES: ArsR family transcriptional regulator [unclassified Streptomyces]MCH0562312.1 ArsR family transcriptional regulator [Streptomyces sp. MUM 2J]MCH0572927.1 ArsR family transcriptional regulator [Streptomyces sp. MUM 136J]
MLGTPVSDRRLDILERLKDPCAHFPPQRCGDLAEDGVTAHAVAVALGVPHRVAETDLTLLARIGLLRTRYVRRRMLYRRDEMRIAEVARMFEKGW